MARTAPASAIRDVVIWSERFANPKDKGFRARAVADSHRLAPVASRPTLVTNWQRGQTRLRRGVAGSAGTGTCPYSASRGMTRF